MSRRVYAIIGGLITIGLISVAGWTWTPSATKKDFEQHVQEANERFKQNQQQLCDKLDQIIELIEEQNK